MVNASIYWGITELFKSKITNMDAFNLMTVLNTNKAVKKQVGENLGVDNINDMIRLAKNVARKTPDEYLKLVKAVMNNSFKRNLVDKLDATTKLCFSDTDGIELYGDIQKKLDTITTEYIDSEVTPFNRLIRPMWDDSRKKLLEEGSYGYAPYIKELEHYFSYTYGELVMYVGKRKVGKSLFAMNESVNLLRQGVGLLYVDTELKDELFMNRILSYLAKTPFKRIQNGDYDNASQERIDTSIDWLEKQNFFHYHMPSYNKDKIYLLAKKLQRNNNINFIVFDHLKTTESKDTSTAYYELGGKANFLKDVICGELGYGGICLAQQNRMGDIGESYRLEQEVSAFVYINEKTKSEMEMDGEKCGTRKLFVKGNRLGDQMDDEDEYIDLGFKGYLCAYENVPQHIVRKDTPF